MKNLKKILLTAALSASFVAYGAQSFHEPNLSLLLQNQDKSPPISDPLVGDVIFCPVLCLNSDLCYPFVQPGLLCDSVNTPSLPEILPGLKSNLISDGDFDPFPLGKLINPPIGTIPNVAPELTPPVIDVPNTLPELLPPKIPIDPRVDK